MKNNVNTIEINLVDPDPIELEMDDELQLKYVGAVHNKLEGLDYEHSGHTGFMPSKLSILPVVDKNVSNDKLRLSVFNSDTETISQIAFNDLKDRIIKTGDAQAVAGLQKGQYYFQEIEKED